MVYWRNPQPQGSSFLRVVSTRICISEMERPGAKSWRKTNVQGQFCVNIQHAVGIPKMDFFSYADSYVVIEVVGVKGQTRSSISVGEKPIWNEVQTLPNGTLSLDPHTTFVKFTLWDQDDMTPDDFIGEATVSVANLLRRPVRSLLIQKRNGDPVFNPDPHPHTCVLKVAAIPKTVPNGWPTPENSPLKERIFPKHIFMMTRGTLGDIEPFVALARGMCNEYGWLVTICTELAFRDFVLSKCKDVTKGAVSFRPSGGDTELHMLGKVARCALSDDGTAEAMQALITAASESNFLSSAPAIMHWVEKIEHTRHHIDFMITSLNLLDVSLLISERCSLPVFVFCLQPSYIPSKEKNWGCLPVSGGTLEFLDQLDQLRDLSGFTRSQVNELMKSESFCEFSVNKLREMYALKLRDTWEIVQSRNIPIVIPMKPGTFVKPSDWPGSTELTDFISLRNSTTNNISMLADSVQKFIAAAGDNKRKLVLMTFSSMPVGRAKWLKCATKMLTESKFLFSLIYVGKKQPDKVSRDLEESARKFKAEGRLLEEEKADFSVLFNYMDCFIVHGGLGTTVEALRRKKPVAVTGILLRDHQFWGKLCSEKRLGPPPVNIEDFYATCVKFVDNALDKDSEWVKAAQKCSVVGESDGVQMNVQHFAKVMKDHGHMSNVIVPTDSAQDAYHLCIDICKATHVPVQSINPMYKQQTYVKVELNDSDPTESTPVSTEHAASAQPVWNELVLLPCDLSQKDFSKTKIRFSLLETEVNLFDNYVGGATMTISDLVRYPKQTLLLEAKNGDPVIDWTAELPSPCQLRVSVRRENMVGLSPPVKRLETQTKEKYPKHVFIMTRGSRGDIEPFVELARGMCNQYGWLVTFCTELSWRSFVKSMLSNITNGGFQFLPCGGDTHLRTSSWFSTEKPQVNSKVQALQTVMMASCESNYFSSAPVFVHHVDTLTHSNNPPDLIVTSFMLLGIALLVAERCSVPLAGFILQPCCIPSQDRNWKNAIDPDSHGMSFVDAFEKRYVSSAKMMKDLKNLFKDDPCSSLSLHDLRKKFGLRYEETWEAVFTQKIPLVIPMSNAVFQKPQDWSKGKIYTPGFVTTGRDDGTQLDDEIEILFANARRFGRKVGLITFSSTAVPRQAVLQIVVKLLRNSLFELALIYVGANVTTEAAAELEEEVDTYHQSGQYLELPTCNFHSLFQRNIDFFIIHGGFGTTLEALRARKPVAVTGLLILDQLFWGHFISSRNIGPPPVHIDEFKETCVNFVENAISNNSTWAAHAREFDVKVLEDAVALNVKCFADIMGVDPSQENKCANR